MESRHVQVVLVGEDYNDFVNYLRKDEWGNPETIGIDFFYEIIDNTTYQVWDTYTIQKPFSSAFLKNTIFKNKDAVIFFDATDEVKIEIKSYVSRSCIFIDYDAKMMTPIDCLKEVNGLILQNKSLQSDVEQEKKTVPMQAGFTRTQTPFNLYYSGIDLSDVQDCGDIELKKMSKAKETQLENPQVARRKGTCQII